MITVASVVPWVGGALAIGGVAVTASRRTELIRRWCLWALGVPIVLGLFWLGAPGTTLLALVAATFAVREYAGLVALPAFDRAALGTGIGTIAVVAWQAPDSVPRVVGACLLLLVLVPVVAGDTSDGLERASRSVLGLVWLGVLAGFTPLGVTALLAFIGVSIADVVAYFAGPGLRGPLLSPLSPAKRWSGTVVGATAGVVAVAATGGLTWQLALAVAVGGPLGDLLESMTKRGVGAKDSGVVMAGAGGLLDRLDSVLGALAALLVMPT